MARSNTAGQPVTTGGSSVPLDQTLTSTQNAAPECGQAAETDTAPNGRIPCNPKNVVPISGQLRSAAANPCPQPQVGSAVRQPDSPVSQPQQRLLFAQELRFFTPQPRRAPALPEPSPIFSAGGLFLAFPAIFRASATADPQKNRISPGIVVQRRADQTRASGSRLHDDLDATIRLGAEGLVELRSFLKRGAMRDDE
jgi:hypothetical protein